MKDTTMLTHVEARLALQVQREGSLSQEESGMLEAHLASCPQCRAYAASLPALEERISRSLQHRWPESRPDPARIASTLDRIQRWKPRRKQNNDRRQLMKTNLAKTITLLGWAAAAVLLVVVLNWGIRTLLPQASLNPPPLPETPAASPTAPVPPTPTPLAGPVEATQPALQPLPPNPARVATFPEVNFSFAIPFPEAPQQVMLYRQELPEALSIEAAQRIAAQLGMQNGGVYLGGNERRIDQEGVYEVNDGRGNLRFPYFAGVFVYEPDAAHSAYTNGEPPPFEERARLAEAYLKEHGLLVGEYTAVEPLDDRYGVHFLPLLEGRPVISGIGTGVRRNGLSVKFNGSGQVIQVDATLNTIQPAKEYPILTAQQAWQRLSQENALQRSQYAILGSPERNTLQTYGRTYLAGQKVTLFGYAVVLESAIPGQAPLVHMRGIPLLGATGLPKNFLQIWGVMTETPGGGLGLSVEGWTGSMYEETYLNGVIHRQGEIVQLVAEDSQILTLPEAPTNLADGEKVFAHGVIMPADGVFDWIDLQSGEPSGASYGVSATCFGGGGGGGGGPEDANFGGGSLSLVPLGQEPGAAPTAVPAPPIPYKVGDPIAAQANQVSVVIYQSAGQQTGMEVHAWIQPELPDQPPFSAMLAGNGLAGIEAYHNLPLKIWGQIASIDNGQITVDVERYEEAYPGLRIQAWIGKEQVVTLDGKEVLLFNTQDGQQFVLKNSIEWGAVTRTGPGDDSQVIHEGLLIPGDTFGGYPVLTDLSAELDDSITDLSAYTITSDKPNLIDFTGPRGQLIMQGEVTIEEIELAYSAVDISGCGGQDAGSPEIQPWLTVQPVWVFRGHFADGRLFEIQIQALPEEILATQ